MTEKPETTVKDSEQNEKRAHIRRTIKYVFIMLVFCGLMYDLADTTARRENAKKNIRTLVARTDSLKTLRQTLRGMESDNVKMPAELFNRIENELDETHDKIPAALDSLDNQDYILTKWLKNKMRLKSK